MKKTKKRKIFFIIMLSAAISFNLTMISAIGFHLITHYVIQSGGAYYETKYVEISISNEYDPMYNQVTFYNGRHFYDEESSTTLNCSFVEKIGENRDYLVVKYEDREEDLEFEAGFYGERCEGYTAINKKTFRLDKLNSKDGEKFIKKERIWMFYSLDFAFIKMFIRDRELEKMEPPGY